MISQGSPMVECLLYVREKQVQIMANSNIFCMDKTPEPDKMGNLDSK